MNIYKWINFISFYEDSKDAMIALILGPQIYINTGWRYAIKTRALGLGVVGGDIRFQNCKGSVKICSVFSELSTYFFPHSWSKLSVMKKYVKHHWIIAAHYLLILKTTSISLQPTTTVVLYNKFLFFVYIYSFLNFFWSREMDDEFLFDSCVRSQCCLIRILSDRMLKT